MIFHGVCCCLRLGFKLFSGGLWWVNGCGHVEVSGCLVNSFSGFLSSV